MTVRRRKVPDPKNRKILVAAYKQARTFIRNSGKAKTATTKATAEAKARTNANAAANELLAKNRNTFIKGYSNLKTPTRLHMSPAKLKALKNKLSDFKQEIARGKAAEKAAEKATAAKATAEKKEAAAKAKEAAAKAKEAANKKATEAKAAEEAANTTLQNVKNLNSSTAAFSLNAARQALSAYNIRHAKLIRFGRKKPEPAAVTSLRSKLKAANTTKSNEARAAALHELQTYAKGTNVETEQLKRLLSAYNRAGTKGQKNNNGVNEIRQKIKIAGVNGLPPISAWLKTHTNRSGNSNDNVFGEMSALLKAYKEAHPREMNIVAPKNVKELRRRMKAVTNNKAATAAASAKAARIEGISQATKISKLNRLRIALGRNKGLKNTRNASNTAAAARRMAEIAQFKTNLNRTNYEVTPAIRTQIAQLKNKNLSKKLANFNRTQNQSRVHLMTLLEGTEPLSLKNRLDIRRRVKNDKLQNALKAFNAEMKTRASPNQPPGKGIGARLRSVNLFGTRAKAEAVAAKKAAAAKKATENAAAKNKALTELRGFITLLDSAPPNGVMVRSAEEALNAYNKLNTNNTEHANVKALRAKLKHITGQPHNRPARPVQPPPPTPTKGFLGRMGNRLRPKPVNANAAAKAAAEAKANANANKARINAMDSIQTISSATNLNRAKAAYAAYRLAHRYQLPLKNAQAYKNLGQKIRNYESAKVPPQKGFLAGMFTRQPQKFNNAKLRKNVNNHFSGTQEIFNKAVIRAILAHPHIKLTNNQRNQLQRKLQTRAGRFAGALGRGAVLAGKALGSGAVAAGGALGRGAVVAGGALGRGAVVAGGALGSGARGAVAYLMKPRIEKLIEIISNTQTRRGERENAIRELYAISKDLRTRMNNKTKAEAFLGTLGNLNSIVKGQKAPGLVSRVLGRSSNNVLPVEYVKNNKGEYIININGKKKAAPPPLGYVLKSYYTKNGNQTTGYFKIKNSKTLQSQLEYMGNGPRPRPTGYYGPRRNNYGNRHNNYYGYGPRRNNRGGSGPSAPSGGIVFAPKINVGAARIGAQTFGGTRVGGQQMGGSRVRTGNAGSTTLKTGNTGGVQVSNVGKVSNAGKANVGTRPTNTGLTVSAPTSNGSRQLAATPEQLIRGAGGAEAIEKGVQALNAANGNVARARAASKLPNNTFTNIYALGGPVAAKKAVALRRRSRASKKKKRVAPKPRKQYVKLTPYQFRRLTDHIKKNNLRKVLIKEITH